MIKVKTSPGAANALINIDNVTQIVELHPYGSRIEFVGNSVEVCENLDELTAKIFNENLGKALDTAG